MIGSLYNTKFISIEIKIICRPAKRNPETQKIKSPLVKKNLKKGPYQYQNKNNPATIPLIFTETELEAGREGGRGTGEHKF